jgi:uncharacterized protein (TIGR02217 family)
MAGFHETSFPDDIAYGSSGGPGYKTTVVTLDSGAEQRVSRWSSPRHRYNAGYGVRDHEDIAALKEFFHARQGAAYGFRFKDFTDCTSTASGLDESLGGAAVANDDVLLGTGDGTQTAFQLVKYYTEGGITRTRTITKPIAGTVVVAVNGVNQTSGWSVNTATGVVTFTTPPTAGHNVTAGFKFEVPVRFGEEVDGYFSTSIDDYSTGSTEVPLIEIVSELESIDEFFYGGSLTVDPMSADQSLSLANGRVIVVAPSTSGLALILPDETSLPDGGPFFIIHNTDSTNAVDVNDDAGSFVASIDAGEMGLVSKASDTWYIGVV